MSFAFPRSFITARIFLPNSNYDKVNSRTETLQEKLYNYPIAVGLKQLFDIGKSHTSHHPSMENIILLILVVNAMIV